MAEAQKHAEENPKDAGGLTATRADIYVIAARAWKDNVPDPYGDPPPIIDRGKWPSYYPYNLYAHERWAEEVMTDQGSADWMLNEGFLYYVVPVPLLKILADEAIKKGNTTTKRNSQCAEVPFRILAKHTLVDGRECVPHGFCTTRPERHRA